MSCGGHVRILMHVTLDTPDEQINSLSLIMLSVRANSLPHIHTHAFFLSHATARSF